MHAKGSMDVLVTTLPSLEGMRVKRYLGLVFGSSARKVPFWRKVKESVRKGGEESEIHDFLKKLRYEAVAKLAENAKKMGANAVLGVRIGIHKVSGDVFEVYAYGTAAEVG